jgi:hypothetical protein
MTKGVYDLSNIHNLEELQEEINLLKLSLKKEEDDLEEHFRRLPQQAIKSAAENLLPSFLNKMIANGTWKVLLSGLTMFANPFSKGFSFKKNIVSSAKRLGMVALLKSVYSFWSNKRAAKNKPADSLKNTPAVTTLKTKSFRKD